MDIHTFALLSDGTELWNATQAALPLVVGNEEFLLPPSGRHAYVSPIGGGIFMGLPYVKSRVVYIVEEQYLAKFAAIRPDVISASAFQLIKKS